jgi:polyisoprenoid-binding protein YceI
VKVSYDAKTAEVRVYTFKEGLLSKVAHDLELAVERFSITVEDETSIESTFDASSLKVLTPLSASDRATIEATIKKEVLEVGRHPSITFRSSAIAPSGDGYRIEGTLELHGRRRSLVVDTRREGEGHRAEVKLHQPDYGIRPYSAMLGTLRIQAGVNVVVRLFAR